MINFDINHNRPTTTTLTHPKEIDQSIPSAPSAAAAPAAPPPSPTAEIMNDQTISIEPKGSSPQQQTDGTTDTRTQEEHDSKEEDEDGTKTSKDTCNNESSSSLVSEKDNNDDDDDDDKEEEEESTSAMDIPKPKPNPWHHPHHLHHHHHPHHHNPQSQTTSNGSSMTESTTTTISTTTTQSLSFIMAEQEDERKQFEERMLMTKETEATGGGRADVVSSVVPKSVTWKEESDEEEMIRLAIEASLADQASAGAAAGGSGSSGGSGGAVAATALEEHEEDMDEDLKLAIRLSMQETTNAAYKLPVEESAMSSYHQHQHQHHLHGEQILQEQQQDEEDDQEGDRKMAASVVVAVEDDDEDLDRKPSSSSSSSTSFVIPVASAELASSASASVSASAPASTSASLSASASTSAFASASTSAFASTSTSTSTIKTTPTPTTNTTTTITNTNNTNNTNNNNTNHINESEARMIARALNEADDLETARSIELAMKLQQDEDRRRDEELLLRNKCDNHGNVRTVGREEFESNAVARKPSVWMMGGGGGGGGEERRLWGENDYEEHQKRYQCSSSGMDGGWNGESNDNDDDDDIQDHGDNEVGYRINPSTPSKTGWSKVDKNTIIGPNNEVRTKHDVELKHRSNAERLMGPNYSQRGQGISGGTNHHHAGTTSHYDTTHAKNPGSGTPSSSSKLLVSDAAYNSFHRSLKNSRGKRRSTVKGVAAHGHGRAENMEVEKTRGGAIDGHVRELISKAINAGLIQRCNGVVQEGKEAIVYHADGGDGTITTIDPANTFTNVNNDGFDVAIKVFKRIQEFRGRGEYVDGDSRYRRQPYHKLDQRQQIEVWTDKEYRNLIRANRAGVPVPTPLSCRKNVLFMRFLGEGGWPALQLREVEGLRKGSSRWTELYFQVLVAVKRLYHCAKLVHGDISEYNILVCPMYLVENAFEGRGWGKRGEGKGGVSSSSMGKSDLSTVGEEKEAVEKEDSLQVVLIDFGQAVELRHPSARTFLCRDLRLIREFFVKQGIDTFSVEESEQFVLSEDIKDDEGDRKNASDKKGLDEGDCDLSYGEDSDDDDDDDDDGEEEEKENEAKEEKKCKIHWDDRSHFEWLEGNLKSSKAIDNSKR